MDYRNLTDEQIKVLANTEKDIKLPAHLETKFLKKIKEEFKPGNITEFKRIRNFKRIALAIAAAAIFVLAPVLIFNLIVTPASTYKVMLAQGSVEVERNGEITYLSVGDRVYEDDKIITNDNSYCTVSLNDDSLIFLNEMSELIFETVNGKNTTLNLIKGQVISSVALLEENEVYEIITAELTVSVVGTVFMVEAGEGTTRVSVNKGIVDIEYLSEESEKEKITLVKSESFTVSEKEYEKKPQKTEGLGEDIIESFDLFESINNIILKEELEENIAAKVNFVDADEEIEVAEEIKYEWQIKNIYDYNNTRYENIINISTSKYYAVAQTYNSFICFNLSGKLMWEKTYDTNESGLFDTPAVIYGNNLFASSTNKLLFIIDLDSGRELNIITTPDILSKYSSMTVYGNNIYLPYANGIYAFDIDNLNISNEPVISFTSPVALLKYQNNYYISSYVAKEISKYDNNYNKIWNVKFDDRLFSIPLVYEKIIISGWSGNVFELDFDGNISRQLIYSDGIISKPDIYNNNVYVLANDGMLIEIGLNAFEIKNNYKIDNSPNPENYIYKSVTINNNNLFIGNDIGEIFIYDLDTGSIEKTFNTNASGINCSVAYSNNTYFVGNDTGEIFMFKLEETK